MSCSSTHQRSVRAVIGRLEPLDLLAGGGRYGAALVSAYGCLLDLRTDRPFLPGSRWVLCIRDTRRRIVITGCTRQSLRLYSIRAELLALGARRQKNALTSAVALPK